MAIEDNGYDWKVSIIAQYTDSWKREFEDFIFTLKAQVTTPRIRIILFKYVADATNPLKKGQYTITQFYIDKPGGGTTTKPKSCDFYNEETLTNFFSTIVKPIKAKQHALITWGHGAGLGYFTRTNSGADIVQQSWFSEIFEQVPGLQPQAAISDIDDLAQQIRFLKANLSIKPDYSAPSQYSFGIQEASYVIKNKSKLDQAVNVISAQMLAGMLKTLDSPVDLFIAGNCFCQMFEPGYDLKDQVRIMVAPQTAYPITGFNYQEFFKAMQSDTGSDPPSLAKNVCINFVAKYTPTYLTDIKNADPSFTNYDLNAIKQVSISANILSFYPDLKQVIDDLATWMNTNFTKNTSDGRAYLSIIKTSREISYDQATELPGIVDIVRFLTVLNTELQSDLPTQLQRIQQRLAKIRTACNLAILEPTNMAALNNIAVSAACPSFLSIFFPHASCNTIQKTLFDSFYGAKATNLSTSQRVMSWDEFVRKFYTYYDQSCPVDQASG